MASSRATRRSSRANTPREAPLTSTRDTSAAAKPTQSIRFTSSAPRQRTQGILDGWVEPPPLKPRASFEEHGLERQGVVANMEPLGTPPSARLKAKLRGDANKRPLLMDPITFADRGSRDTPETLPSGQETREHSAHVEEGTSQEPEKEEMAEIGGDAVQMPQSNSTRYPLHKLERVVKSASNLAEVNKDAHTAAAIKKMWSGGMADMSIIPALGAVLSRKPSKAQRDAFRAYVKREKQAAKHASEPPLKKLKLSFKQPRKDLPATTPTGSPAKKTVELAHRTPSKDLQATSVTDMTSSPPPQPPLAKMATPKQSKVNGSTTAHNEDSDSELSAIDEEIAEGPPPDSIAAGGSSPASRDSRLRRNISRSIPASQLQFAFEPQTGSRSKAKRVAEDADMTETEDSEEVADIARRRQAKLRNFNNLHIPQSQIRPEVTGISVRGTQRSTTPRVNGLTNGDTTLRAHDRVKREDASSSRASTPAAAGLSRTTTGKRAQREPGQRRKIIISPQKKVAVVAGHAPKIGGVDGVGGGAHLDDLDSDEADSCGACSGNGFLLQCDGCDRAFHLSCLDPPRDSFDLSDLELEDWYCNVCTVKLVPIKDARHGIFGQLLDNVESRNPAAFSLPSRIRDFFENVQTGEDGEYEETGNWIQLNAKNGYTGVDDLYKLTTTKNTPVLCISCGKSSLDGRAILQCTICHENWHMDCVDPPMAAPPPVNLEGTKRQAFKCPRHVLHDLKGIDPTAQHAAGQSRHANGYRMHRVRKPKVPTYVTPALERGFRNNGIIEIENDESDSDESEFMENEEDGVVYRLPEKGIKLDFISKVKSQRILQQQRNAELAAANASTTASSLKRPITTQLESHNHTTAEQQIALSLIQHAQREGDVGLDASDMDALIMSLVAEAPEQVVSDLTRSQKRVCKGLDAPAAANSSSTLDFLTRLGNVIEDAKKRVAAQQQEQR